MCTFSFTTEQHAHFVELINVLCVDLVGGAERCLGFGVVQSGAH